MSRYDNAYSELYDTYEILCIDVLECLLSEMTSYFTNSHNDNTEVSGLIRYKNEKYIITDISWGWPDECEVEVREDLIGEEDVVGAFHTHPSDDEYSTEHDILLYRHLTSKYGKILMFFVLGVSEYEYDTGNYYIGNSYNVFSNGEQVL